MRDPGNEVGEAFADASLLGSPSDVLSSYELAAFCSVALNRLKDFVSAFPRSYFLFCEALLG